MATKSLTFSKIEGITSGSAFTVNAYASDKTVSAIVYFESFDSYVDITKFTPKIGSVKVGGQNWLSTEIIKITYEMGIVQSDSNEFLTLSGQFSNASHQVSEKDGTVPSSVSMPVKSSIGKLSLAPKPYVTHIAYKITVESTQNLVGCKVVMSDFQLSLDYTVQSKTINVYSSPTEGGTVTGPGTFPSGTTVTISATPNAGYVFKEWRVSIVNGQTELVTTNATYSFKSITGGNYYAIFEKTAINKIYIGTSQPKKIYVGTQEVKAVYVGTTKVYG